MEAALAMTSLKLKLPKVLPPHFYAGSQMEATDGGWLAMRKILADIILTIAYMTEPTIAPIIPLCNVTIIWWRQIIINCRVDRSMLLMTAVTWA